MTPLQLLSLFLAAAVCVDAFVTTSPTQPRSFLTTAANIRHPTPLFVVADPPNREEEKEKLNRRNDNDDTTSWVETSNGGFLPNIPRAIKQKLAPPVVKPTEVVTIQEYKAVVADEKDQMVCVRFYAPWCKACKAVQQPFRKLCRDNPSVKFVEVPLTKNNAFLHEGLGIPSLPYGHIYHPTVGLVEELKMKKGAEFKHFTKTLETYVQGECHVEYSDDNDEVCRQAA